MPYCKLFPDILMFSNATITEVTLPSGCKPNSGKSFYHLHNRCSKISVKSPLNLALSNNSFYLCGLFKVPWFAYHQYQHTRLCYTFGVIITFNNIRSTNSKESGSSPSMYISPVTTVPQTLHIHRSNINAMYRQLTA